MNERERLIEMLADVGLCHYDTIADHLLANGVIVPPCKVGDMVYVLDDYVDHEECCKCEHYLIGGFGDPSECGRTKYGFKHPDCIQIVEETATFGNILRWITPSLFTEKIDFGKTVFLTKEEAEKALAEREQK
jgi:hypothetical protein